MKKFILLLTTLLCFFTLCMGLTACDKGEVEPSSVPSHGHSYSDEWSQDKANHWHTATCEHTDAVKDKAEHTLNSEYVCTVCGYDATTKGLAYTLSGDGTYYIVSGIGTAMDTEIFIPATYDSKPVKRIASEAFSYCSELTSITIPNSVTSIGSEAFIECSGLTSVVIPDSVTTIGDYAFYGCSGLTSIVIPDGVTTIEDYVFSDCLRLTSVVIPDSVTTIGDDAFSDCLRLTSVVIPDSVTSIGEWAFSDCLRLTSIVIPDGVTSIGDRAFSNCRGLTSLTVTSGNTKYHSAGNCLIETASKTLIAGCKNSVIPTDGSVTSIGERAFSNCNGLTSIVIPNSVTVIGNAAFFRCRELTVVTFEGTTMQFQRAHIGTVRQVITPCTVLTVRLQNRKMENFCKNT